VVVLLLLGAAGFFQIGPIRPGADNPGPLRPGDVALSVALVLLQTLPLLGRRRWPIAVMVCVVGAFFSMTVLVGRSSAAGLGIILAVYSVAVYADQVRRVVVGAFGVVLLVAALSVYLATGTHLTLVFPGIAFIAAWLLGDYIRTRRAYLAELEERTLRAEQDRDADRRRAADEERARIARELHDVIAHHVSVIAVQAGAGRLVQDGDPRAAARTLATVETTARQALVELSRLLGVIRKENEGASPREPQPGLDQLDALVQRARDAGLDVELAVRGRPRSLPAALDLSAYRIVQEAVTNVIKHAPRAHVRVALRYGDGELDVRVTDDGRGRPSGAPEPRGGHGIVGMQERVALFGGDLQAGPRPEGGFEVAARLPLAMPAP
jgi:signal transduction histidine kinase